MKPKVTMRHALSEADLLGKALEGPSYGRYGASCLSRPRVNASQQRKEDSTPK